MRVLTENSGGRRVSVSDLGSALTEHAAPPEAAPAPTLELPSPAGLILPGDPDWRGVEARHGAWLRDGLGAGALGRLEQLLAAAQGAGELPVLVMEAPALADRARCWELLVGAEGRPLEASRRAVIARLAPSGARTWTPVEPGDRLRVLLWCPHPEDPALARLVAGLDEHARATGCAPPTRIAPGAPPPPSPGAVSVLHIVVHGAQALDQVILSLREGPMGAGTLAHALGDAIQGVLVAHLAVCEGDAPTAEQVDSLAGALLDAGCRAVLAPAERVSAHLSLTLAVALQAALLDGQPLAAAVAAARAAVAGAALPERSMRWWQARLTVGDLRDLEAPPPLRAWWLQAGWPPPDLAALPLLRRAGALAAQGACGFVGVEHLALAQLGMDPPLGSRRLQAQLQDQLEQLQRALLSFTPKPGASPGLAPTPRLEGIAEGLAPGFIPEQLWRALAEDGGHWLRLDEALPPRVLSVRGASQLTGALDGSALVQPSPPQISLRRPARLSVVGGPEDGLQLRGDVGEILGRWEPGPASARLALFRRTSAVDRAVSSRHLMLLEDMALEVLQRVRRVRGGLPQDLVKGPCEVQPGDLLFLSRGTALRVA